MKTLSLAFGTLQMKRCKINYSVCSACIIFTNKGKTPFVCLDHHRCSTLHALRGKGARLINHHEGGSKLHATLVVNLVTRWSHCQIAEVGSGMINTAQLCIGSGRSCGDEFALSGPSFVLRRTANWTMVRFFGINATGCSVVPLLFQEEAAVGLQTSFKHQSLAYRTRKGQRALILMENV